MAGNGAIIFQWLERIGLGYSIPTFQAMGITNPHSLVTLTVEDYDAGTPTTRALAPPLCTLSCAGFRPAACNMHRLCGVGAVVGGGACVVPCTAVVARGRHS